jgi:steroid delta-isomerase-like uncharacterized protein
MASDASAALIRRYFDCLTGRADAATLDAVVAPDVVFREPGRLLAGRPALARRAADFQAAFPDIEVAVEDLVDAGDRVAGRWTLTGTHRGAFGPFPPTGNRVTLSGMINFRLAGGVITEGWGCFDTLGAMQQLGATVTLPGGGAPETPPAPDVAPQGGAA